MRFVCPRDIEKVLVQRARSVYWKKWAAKHEHEKLKEGAWLEPALASSLAKESKTEMGPKSIVMWSARSSWRVVGRNRDCSILAGRM